MSKLESYSWKILFCASPSQLIGNSGQQHLPIAMLFFCIPITTHTDTPERKASHMCMIDYGQGRKRNPSTSGSTSEAKTWFVVCLYLVTYHCCWGCPCELPRLSIFLSCAPIRRRYIAWHSSTPCAFSAITLHIIVIARLEMNCDHTARFQALLSQRLFEVQRQQMVITVFANDKKLAWCRHNLWKLQAK